MSCTTLLVGRAASYDGSTMIARDEDCGNGELDPQRMEVVMPEKQPHHYRSANSHVELDLPEGPLRYTSFPEADTSLGIWAAGGINAANVAMTACETITTNPRVLGADPLVELVPAVGEPGDEDYVPERCGGIGEEDMVTLVLPYVLSAREGVRHLGELLERYGTYESNGIAFSDAQEIWWLETVGGHHWIARRVPDDCYVAMPNQLGIDRFDLNDAEGAQRDYMASADLRAWMGTHHLDLTIHDGEWPEGVFNPRLAFGSSTDQDRVYNTPRAWDMQRYLSPRACVWEGPNADYTPRSNDMPWCRKADRKLTVEDVKETLGLHYQGTAYDPYGPEGTEKTRHLFRPTGISRNRELHILQIRPQLPEAISGVQWLSYGSNPFNASVAQFAGVESVPRYLTYTPPRQVTTESFFWASGLIAALADAHFLACSSPIALYQEKVAAAGHAMVARVTDEVCSLDLAPDAVRSTLEQANDELVSFVRKETDDLLYRVLLEATSNMRNAFVLNDR